MTTTATAAYSVKRKPGEPPRPSGLPAAVPKAATQARAFLALLKTEVSRAELVHQLENAPATAGHARQGVIRHHDRETCFLGEQLVDVAQQPVSTMPRSATSAPSSGGVCSSACFTALTMLCSGSCSASRISLLFSVKLRGTPSERLRPFTDSSRTC